jgi:phosphate/sulfate permease
MANGSSSAMKIIGIVLVVVGIGLAFWGYRLSGSIGSQLTHALTGADTDQVMRFYIGGAASFVVGLFLLFR